MATFAFVPRPARGVTLVELMITLAILAIFALLATPSFLDFRERRIVSGAADDMVNQIALYRFEAVKLNRAVTLGVDGYGAAAWCVGARIGTTACDCNAADCDVGRFPANAGELRGARLLAGGNLGPLTFDPSTGTLTSLDQGGAATIESATNRHGYRLTVTVNPLGRPSVCIPAGATQFGGYAPCG